MDYSVYKISLDIHKPEAQEVLEMKLLDSKRRIQISLTENGKVYQITPDCKAMFSAGKSDGNKIYNQCEIVDNTIIYDVTQQTLACLGEVDCEVQLLGSDEAVITSPRFSIIVHDRVYNGEDIVDSEMETNVLPDLIAKSHEHENKAVLDKFKINNGLYYDGVRIRIDRDGAVISQVHADANGDIYLILNYGAGDSETLIIKAPPTKASQLENDVPYVSESKFNGLDTEFSQTIDAIANMFNEVNARIDGIASSGSGGGLTPEQAAQLAENTRQLAENTYQIGEHTLQIQYLNELYNVFNPSAYATHEEFNILAQNLQAVLDQHNTAVFNELTAITTRIDSIEGGIDEIEAMIDESGVLD